MNKDHLIFIKHVLGSIEIIENYLGNISKEDFMKDQKLQDAVIRRLEVIGEAVKNIPYELREKYPKIPWQGIAGTRDKLTHHYFGIDLELIWNVTKDDLPVLKKEIKKILDKF